MTKTFLVSDTHFGHAGICRFTDDNGEKVRPWDCPDKMTEDMVEQWNAVVGDNDKVYHLGDVVINRRCLPVCSRLKGRKTLIKGNHDNFRLSEYSEYFDDILAYHSLAGFLLSHIPIHPGQFERWKGNIHGHTHLNHLSDPRYMNICVEQTNYQPILLSEVLTRYADRGIV